LIIEVSSSTSTSLDSLLECRKTALTQLHARAAVYFSQLGMDRLNQINTAHPSSRPLRLTATLPSSIATHTDASTAHRPDQIPHVVRQSRLTSPSCSVVYSCFGIFIIPLSKTTLILRHPWKMIFRGNHRPEISSNTTVKTQINGDTESPNLS